MLDLREAMEDLESAEQRKTRESIYGVPPEAMVRSDPSVVSINGVVASLGVAEFMAYRTCLRKPHGLLNFDGAAGRVTLNKDEPPSDCYYCKGIWGCGPEAKAERYLRMKRFRSLQQFRSTAQNPEPMTAGGSG